MGGEARKPAAAQQPVRKRPHVKRSEAAPSEVVLDHFGSGFFSNVLSEHFCSELAMMTISHDDIIDSDCESETVTFESYQKAELGLVDLGKDLSMHLGKDASQVPFFTRFANPPIDIQVAVQEMRLVLGAKRASKQRSWAAGFSFNKRSSKKPQFERFAEPSIDIQAAVQQMRDAAVAKRASRRRSWHSVFTFPKKTKTLRLFRFSNFPADIAAAVQETRLATVATRASKQRSWAATFSFTGKLSQKPRFARFAEPPIDIGTAVREMRVAAAAHRAAKQNALPKGIVDVAGLLSDAVMNYYYEEHGTGTIDHDDCDDCGICESDTESTCDTAEDTAAIESKQNAIPEGILDVAGLLSDAVINHYYADHGLMTIHHDDCDDCGSCESDTESACDRARDIAAIDERILELEVELGKDISTQLGKDFAKVPACHRFASMAGNIQDAVQELRLAATVKRAAKHRSWTASFSFTKRSSKKARFERFASPSVNIQTAVQSLRSKLAARRAANSVSVLDEVLIEDVENEPMDSLENEPLRITCSIAPIFPDGAKMLMAPPSEMEETRDRLQSLLRCFQHEILKAQGYDVAKFLRRLSLPEPGDSPVPRSPADPQVANTEVSMQSSSMWPSYADKEELASDAESEALTLCEQCAWALNKFSLEAAAFEEEQKFMAESDLLIQEEQSRHDRANTKKQRPRPLDDQMLNTLSTWVAGSPAAAARRMRRSTPCLFRMDTDDGAAPKARESSITRGYEALDVPFYSLESGDKKETGLPSRLQVAKSTSRCNAVGQGSAMSLDLGFSRTLRTPSMSMSQDSGRSHKSARASSMAAVRVTKSKGSLETLRPLANSKSSSGLMPFPSLTACNDPHAWSIGPLRCR